MKILEMFFYLVLVVVVALRVNQFLGWVAKKFFIAAWALLHPKEEVRIGRAQEFASTLGQDHASSKE